MNYARMCSRRPWKWLLLSVWGQTWFSTTCTSWCRRSTISTTQRSILTSCPSSSTMIRHSRTERRLVPAMCTMSMCRSETKLRTIFSCWFKKHITIQHHWCQYYSWCLIQWMCMRRCRASTPARTRKVPSSRVSSAVRVLKPSSSKQLRQLSWMVTGYWFKTCIWSRHGSTSSRSSYNHWTQRLTPSLDFGSRCLSWRIAVTTSSSRVSRSPYSSQSTSRWKLNDTCNRSRRPHSDASVKSV